MRLNKLQKETLGKFFVDMSKIVLTIFVISGLIPKTELPIFFVIIGLLIGIALLTIGLSAIKGEVK